MSKIQWTNETWNPVVGCTRASRGCDHCYAVTMTHRLGAMAEADRAKGTDPGKKAMYEGLTVLNNRGERHFNGTVRCVEDALTIPLGWKKPRLCFVNSMSDLFHKDVPFEFIDRVFAVMALCPQHTFQILTKRPERMAEYFDSFQDWTEVDGVVGFERLGVAAGQMLDGGWIWGPGKRHRQAIRDFISDAYNWYDEETEREPKPIAWPLPNVWLGTSVEDQAAADERIPHLLRCPAAVRFLSCEPLLGSVDLTTALPHYKCDAGGTDATYHGESHRTVDCGWRGLKHPDDARGKKTETPQGHPHGRCLCLRAGVDYIFGGVNWVIVGGESGKGSRPCNIDWIRSIRDQCRDAGVACFVKQLGAVPGFDPKVEDGSFHHTRDGLCIKKLTDKKGGDIDEWPEDLRVREMPEVAHAD